MRFSLKPLEFILASILSLYLGCAPKPEPILKNDEELKQRLLAEYDRRALPYEQSGDFPPLERGADYRSLKGEIWKRFDSIERFQQANEKPRDLEDMLSLVESKLAEFTPVISERGEGIAERKNTRADLYIHDQAMKRIELAKTAISEVRAELNSGTRGRYAELVNQIEQVESTLQYLNRASNYFKNPGGIMLDVREKHSYSFTLQLKGDASDNGISKVRWEDAISIRVDRQEFLMRYEQEELKGITFGGPFDSAQGHSSAVISGKEERVSFFYRTDDGKMETITREEFERFKNFVLGAKVDHFSIDDGEGGTILKLNEPLSSGILKIF